MRPVGRRRHRDSVSTVATSSSLNRPQPIFKVKSNPANWDFGLLVSHLQAPGKLLLPGQLQCSAKTPGVLWLGPLSAGAPSPKQMHRRASISITMVIRESDNLSTRDQRLAPSPVTAKFGATEPRGVSEWPMNADSNSGLAVLRAASVEHSSVLFGRAVTAVTVCGVIIAVSAKATRIAQGPKGQ